MSSDEDLHDIDDGGIGELTGHGDMSKRRKVLSHCSTYKLDCTFVEGAKKRSPPKAYIDDLERRVELLEQLIRRVAPTVNIDDEVGPSFNKHTWAAVKGASSASRASRPSTGQQASSSSALLVLPQHQSSTLASSMLQSPLSGTTLRSSTIDSSAAQEDREVSDAEDNFPGSDVTPMSMHVGLENKMRKLEVGEAMERRFHGKSSGVTLVQAALTLKEEVTGIPARRASGEKSANMRPKFWKPSPWEWMTSAVPPIDSLKFPPSELMRTLVDRCFSDVMTFMPILHKPSFEKALAEEKHRKDLDFARLLLIVCSVGSRFCHDPRVCLTSPEGEIEWSSAGWVYFAQVYQTKSKPLLVTAKLIDLQIMALTSTYLQATSAPHGAWLIIGVSLRFAEDVGIHREKVYGADHAFENQMWKRAFWCLVVTDKLLSASLGRPMCINDEDIDANLPLEVDDENWDEATQTWIQPAGKPSKLAYFVNHAKLIGILAHAMRTIYSINKSKVHLGFIGPEWEQHTVAELDSALNGWLDAVPDHLRWDPHMGPEFFQQAAALRLTFYYVQITIHRPFIQLSPSSKRVSPLSLPSLAICANAARSSAHILNSAMEMSAPAMFTMIAFISGLVLMISIWEARRSGLNVEVSTQVADVHTCLKYLKRWENSDILRETASVSEVPIPPSQQNSPPDTTMAVNSPTYGNVKKRERDNTSSPHGDHPRSVSGRGTQGASVNAPRGAPTPSDASTPASTSSYIPPSPAGSSQYSQPSPAPHHVMPPKQQQHLTSPVLANASGSQWGLATAPPSGVYTNFNTLAPSAPRDSMWENYHIAGSGGMPGLGMGFQSLPGYAAQSVNGVVDPLSPNSFLQDLLGPLADGQVMGGNAPTMQPDYWNSEPMAQWNWMNDVPGAFGAPQATPRHPQ
ncbi:hypothetical protein FRB97_001320 [Tulasnella sp. 331]|nr:hypothetical protein FRB98_005589 [Tulasnella sp. 332]KAG8879902.1 hypothetical protein FRB97_001320 [Tulasnella sp. 331]